MITGRATEAAKLAIEEISKPRLTTEKMTYRRILNYTGDFRGLISLNRKVARQKRKRSYSGRLTRLQS